MIDLVELNTTLEDRLLVAGVSFCGNEEDGAGGNHSGRVERSCLMLLVVVVVVVVSRCCCCCCCWC